MVKGIEKGDQVNPRDKNKIIYKKDKIEQELNCLYV